MAADSRPAARQLAREHIGRGDPLGWFEALYHGAKGDPSRIPWADLAPNPLFSQWLAANPLPEGTPALKVGCGLGDDAEAPRSGGSAPCTPSKWGREGKRLTEGGFAASNMPDLT